MANGCHSTGAVHLRLCISSLLLAAVLLAHSTRPAAGCSGTPSKPLAIERSEPPLEGVASAKFQHDQESSCRLAGDTRGGELCATDKHRRKQNTRQKKKKEYLETSARYGRVTGEQIDKIHLAPSESDKHDRAQRWRYRYFEEQAQGFQVKVQDESFDERLANVINTITSTRPVNIDFFTYNSGDPLEDAANMEAAAGPYADPNQCARDLDEMLSLLDDITGMLAHKRANSSARLHFNEKHLRLARVLDSYGRYESGHLSGKQHVPGQPSQCTSTDLLLSGQAGGGNQRRVSAGFCWARMALDKHLNGKLARRLRSAFEAAEYPLMLGICLPRTCHSKTFAMNRERIQRLVDSQFKLPKSLYIEETLPVDSIYCSVDTESAYARLPLAGKLALTFLGAWLALTLYATFTATDSGANSRPAPIFWQCLDLRKSWHEFLNEHEDPTAQARHESQVRQRKVELDTLNPIKVIGCAFVVIGHSLVLRTATALDGLKAYYLWETDPVLMAMIVGTVIVDSFFVITGILIGYVVMRQANRRKSDNGVTPRATGNGQVAVSALTQKAPCERKSKQSTSVARMFLTHWLKFAVVRHLRLVPLFFLVFWFKKSVFISYFSSWPFWDAGFNKDTNFGACRRESWTTPFSVMAAFLPLSMQCLPQAWSVANDLFFSMTIPPVVLVMPRRPKLALAMGLTLILISNSWALWANLTIDPYLAYEVKDLRAHGFASIFGGAHYLYTYPHFRFCSVLIGLLGGYYLYYFGEHSDELKEWPRWFRGLATKASIGTLIGIVYGFSQIPALKYYIAPYHLGIVIHLFTSGRIVWALCNVVLFMRMASDWRKNSLMRMSSGRFWQALSRLNLAILLIHLDVLLYILESNTQLGFFSKQNIATYFSAGYSYCIPLAILLHVVYENPVDKLIRHFVMPKLFATNN